MAGIKISDLPAVPSAQLTDVYPVDQGAVTYKETPAQLLVLFQANGAALTRVDDTNVTLTLAGSPSIALLNATSITAGWTGQLSPARGGTGVNNGTSTFTIGGNFSMVGAFTFAGTLTNNTAVTFPTSGTLATTSQIPTGAALTRVDDTNVTLTLGGSPATALVNAASITAGWTGQLSLARGGTNKNITADNGALVYSDADSFELLASTPTANKIVYSGASSAPSWSVPTFPVTSSATARKMIVSDGTNYVASTETWAVPGTTGNILTSDGTNWTSAAPAVQAASLSALSYLLIGA